MAFIEGNKSVHLLVDVEILDKAFSQEVVEIFETKTQILDVLISDFGLAVLNNDEWSNKSATVRGYEDTHAVWLFGDVDGHEFLNPTFFSQESEISYELSWLSVNANWLTIKINEKVLWRM